jgi:hypothetical protein
MKYNLSEIMHRAWAIFRKGKTTFAEALHRAWQAAKAEPINEQRVTEAKTAAGITEETHSWAGWKAMGFEVVHESKCLFQAVVVDAAKGDGKTKVKSYFGVSQVQPITAA